MSKLWTFGCSFTDTDAFPSVKDYSWPVLLSKQLDYELHDFGKSGGANQGITWKLIDQLPNIEKNDIVIVGLTHPERVSVPAYIRNKLRVDCVSTGMFHEGSMEFKSGISRFGKESFYSMIDYILHTVRPNLNAYEKLYLDQAYNILSLLEEKEVKTIVWDFNIWYLFEQFRDWCDTEDSHWSPNGHFEVALFFKYCLSRGISKADYLTFKKYSKGYVKREYIEFKEKKFKQLMVELGRVTTEKEKRKKEKKLPN